MAAVATWDRPTFRGNPRVYFSDIDLSGGIVASRTLTGDIPFSAILSASAVTATQISVGGLSTRTDDDTGVVTALWPNHGVETGDTVDLSWSGGSRTGMTVGTVALSAIKTIPVDGGSGDVLPAADTTVTMSFAAHRPYKQLEFTWNVEVEDGGGGWEAVPIPDYKVNPVSGETVDNFVDYIGGEYAPLWTRDHLIDNASTDFRVTLSARGPDGAGGYVTDSVTTTVTVNPWTDPIIWIDQAGGDNANDGLDPQGFSLSGATYDHTGGTAERLLTSSGAFSGYTFADDGSNYIYISAATGGVAVGLYKISSKVDSNSITLASDARLTADATGISSSDGPEQSRPTPASDRWYMHKRGYALDCGTTTRLLNNSNIDHLRFSAYGTGNKPRFYRSGGTTSNTLINLVNNPGDVIDDIVFDNIDVDAAQLSTRCVSVGGTGPKTNILFLDTTLQEATSNQVNGGNGISGFIFRRTTVTDTLAASNNGIFMTKVPWTAYVECSIDGAGTDNTLDHHIYASIGDGGHMLMHANSFGAAINRNYCGNIDRDNDTDTNDQWVWVSDNDCDGTGGILRGFDSSNNGNNQSNGFIDQVVMEGNAIHDMAKDAFRFYNADIAIRDNVSWNIAEYHFICGCENQPFDYYNNRCYVASGDGAINNPLFRFDDSGTTGYNAAQSNFFGNTIQDNRAANTTNRLIYYHSTNNAAMLIDFNQYDETDTTVFYDEVSGAGTEIDFAAWQALATGLDANSTNQDDPGWTDAATGDFTTADATAPTLSSATINTAGTTLTLVFDEAVTTASAAGLTLTGEHGAITPTYSSGSGTDTIIYTLSRTAYDGETITLDHDNATSDIADTSSNQLADISDGAITNNSTVPAPGDTLTSSLTTNLTANLTSSLAG